MQRLLASFCGVALAGLLAPQTYAQPAAPQPPQDKEYAAFLQEQTVYRQMPDTHGSGPFPAAKLLDPAFPDFVVYRPQDPTKLGNRKMPVLLWGNGGCSDDGASERLFLEEIASHGYLVLAPGRILSGPGAPPVAPQSGPPKLQAKTRAQQIMDGLDRAEAANHAPGPLRGRIDTGRMAVAGFSCGGLQAIQLAGDPRTKAVIVLHSGTFLSEKDPIEGIHVDKSLLHTFHTPIFYLMGGQRDIAYPNGSDDAAKIDAVPVFLASHDVGHSGTFMQANGGIEAQLVRQWLDWQLLGDQAASRNFRGADCLLCKAPGWTTMRKGM